MSRGLGSWQRRILEVIDGKDKLVPLGGSTRSEKAAILRAAKLLEKAGRCVIVRLWDDGHKVVRPYVGRPDLTFGGKPAKKLSVARVPCGTGEALTGSLRHMAAYEGVSKTQIDRDIQDCREEEE